MGGVEKNNSLIGISKYYQPFFKQDMKGNKKESEIIFPNTNVILQPQSEENFAYLKDNEGNELEQLFISNWESRQNNQTDEFFEY